MAELKKMYEELGFQDVITYIQSGNVIFKTKQQKSSSLSHTIQAAIKETFGYEVPVLVITRETLLRLTENNPYKDRDLEHKFLHLTLLAETPSKDRLKTIQGIKFPGEEFNVTEEVIYLCLPNGYGRTKLTNTFFESKLKVPTTSRNLRTIHKLLELSIKS